MRLDVPYRLVGGPLDGRTGDLHEPMLTLVFPHVDLAMGSMEYVYGNPVRDIRHREVVYHFKETRR